MNNNEKNFNFESGVIGSVSMNQKEELPQEDNVFENNNTTGAKVEQTEFAVINEKANLVTSVIDKNQIKDKGNKNIIFSLILLAIVAGFIVLFYFMIFNNENVSLNKKNIDKTTTEHLEEYCNDVSLKKFLYHYELDENNIEFLKADSKKNQKRDFYYLVYEGYTFEDAEYVLLKKNENIVCGTSDFKTSELLNNHELKIKYDNLTGTELKGLLKKENKFKRFNMVSSLYNLKNMFKKMNLSTIEINDEIKNIDNNYDLYIDSLNNVEEAKYTKEELINVLSSLN